MNKKFVFFILVILITGIILLQFRPSAQETNKKQNFSYQDVLELTNIYPHNSQSFTEGLFFYQGNMYESTGLYGESFLYRNIDLKTSIPEQGYTFPYSIFAEGSTVLNDQLYVLTYRENKVYVFDPITLQVQKIMNYPREGWGLTNDGEHLIASDGSSTIYFMNSNLEVLKTIHVSYQGKEIDNVNELEYINGYLFANVWKTNDILVINADTGIVEKKIDFTGLYDSNNDQYVLNGIAYNPQTKKIYITGKCWPNLYEFEIKERMFT